MGARRRPPTAGYPWPTGSLLPAEYHHRNSLDVKTAYEPDRTNYPEKSAGRSPASGRPAQAGPGSAPPRSSCNPAPTPGCLVLHHRTATAARSVAAPPSYTAAWKSPSGPRCDREVPERVVAGDLHDGRQSSPGPSRRRSPRSTTSRRTGPAEDLVRRRDALADQFLQPPVTGSNETATARSFGRLPACCPRIPRHATIPRRRRPQGRSRKSLRPDRPMPGAGCRHRRRPGRYG
jgi:hypothetical protein